MGDDVCVQKGSCIAHLVSASSFSLEKLVHDQMSQCMKADLFREAKWSGHVWLLIRCDKANVISLYHKNSVAYITWGIFTKLSFSFFYNIHFSSVFSSDVLCVRVCAWPCYLHYTEKKAFGKLRVSDQDVIQTVYFGPQWKHLPASH